VPLVLGPSAPRRNGTFADTTGASLVDSNRDFLLRSLDELEREPDGCGGGGGLAGGPPLPWGEGGGGGVETSRARLHALRERLQDARGRGVAFARCPSVREGVLEAGRPKGSSASSVDGRR